MTSLEPADRHDLVSGTLNGQYRPKTIVAAEDITWIQFVPRYCYAAIAISIGLAHASGGVIQWVCVMSGLAVAGAEKIKAALRTVLNKLK